MSERRERADWALKQVRDEKRRSRAVRTDHVGWGGGGGAVGGDFALSGPASSRAPRAQTGYRKNLPEDAELLGGFATHHAVQRARERRVPVDELRKAPIAPSGGAAQRVAQSGNIVAVRGRGGKAVTVWRPSRQPRPAHPDAPRACQDDTAASRFKAELRPVLPEKDAGLVGKFIGKGGSNLTQFKRTHRCTVDVQTAEDAERGPGSVAVHVRLGADSRECLEVARRAAADFFAGELKAPGSAQPARPGPGATHVPGAPAARAVVPGLFRSFPGRFYGKAGRSIRQLREEHGCEFAVTFTEVPGSSKPVATRTTLRAAASPDGADNCYVRCEGCGHLVAESKAGRHSAECQSKQATRPPSTLAGEQCQLGQSSPGPAGSAVDHRLDYTVVVSADTEDQLRKACHAVDMAVGNTRSKKEQNRQRFACPACLAEFPRW